MKGSVNRSAYRAKRRRAKQSSCSLKLLSHRNTLIIPLLANLNELPSDLLWLPICFFADLFISCLIFIVLIQYYKNSIKLISFPEDEDIQKIKSNAYSNFLLLKNKVVDENKRSIKKKYRGNQIIFNSSKSLKIYCIVNTTSRNTIDIKRATRLDLAIS